MGPGAGELAYNNFNRWSERSSLWKNWVFVWAARFFSSRFSLPLVIDIRDLKKNPFIAIAFSGLFGTKFNNLCAISVVLHVTCCTMIFLGYHVYSLPRCLIIPSSFYENFIFPEAVPYNVSANGSVIIKAKLNLTRKTIAVMFVVIIATSLLEHFTFQSM